MNRHAHIYKDSQACHTAFRDFTAGSGYQRSESGLWYASNDETHNFFSAAHPEKLRGINWDTMEIAKDVTPLQKAILIWSCMAAGFEGMKVITTTEPTKIQSQRS